MAEPPEVFLIGVPTASGKSALALRLAEAIGAEIVGADALQLYRDLAILTARPSPGETARAPHHLFGVADAAEAWSVGRWLEAALPVLADIRARGRPAIVVGGTGLYFKALTQGLAEIPQVPAEVRRRVSELYDRLGEAAFREALVVDDATWIRGRGRTLSQALIALPYYRRSNPAMAHNARHVIRAVLDEG